MWGQMAKIAVTLVNENLAHARNGEVVLYKRGDSKRWQARFKLKDLKWHRVATKHVNIQYAAETACEAYDRARFLYDEKIPITSKRFDSVAFPQFSRQILLSKSEWEKCKCKKPNTQLSSKKRRFAKLSTGATPLSM